MFCDKLNDWLWSDTFHAETREVIRLLRAAGKDEDNSFVVSDDGTLTYIPKGKTKAQLLKPGKLLKLALGDGTVGPLGVERFVNAYKARFCADGYTYSLVSGEELLNCYNSDNYYTGSAYQSHGELWSSCMNNDFSYLELYAKNPDVCSLLSLSLTDSAGESGQVARALVWKTSDGKTILDRVYHLSPSHATMMQQYARKQGWWVRETHSCFTDPDTGTEQRLDLSVRLTQAYFDEYPYVDTFCYISRGTATLYNTYQSYAVELNRTDGEWPGDDEDDDDSSIYSEYHGDYIDEDEAIWSDVLRDYIRTRDSVLVRGRIYPDDHDDIVEATVSMSKYAPTQHRHIDDCFCDHDGDYYDNDLRHLFVESDSDGELYLLTSLDDQASVGDVFLGDGGKRMVWMGKQDKLVAEDELLTDIFGNQFVSGNPDYVEVHVADGSITGHHEYRHWTLAPAEQLA